MVRSGTRNFKRWNRAADYVINNMLIDNGYELPPGGLWDTKYNDMSTEQVYDLLEDDGDPNFDQYDLSPSPIDSDMSPEEVEQKVQDIIVKASIQSKMGGDKSGSIPSDIQRELDKLLNPKLDWRTILQNYVSAFAKEDYSYKKPNRRYMPDFYLPSLYSEAVGEIAIAVDTSGSVTDKEFQAFLSEINAIKNDLNPALTTVIDFDTSIKNVHKLTADQSIDSVKFSGYGGTQLDCVFNYYKKDVPVVLIVFSDLYCPPIQTAPEYPVIWVVVNNPSATTHFGQKIDYDTNDL
jgi:predicted metal-dependent peptidase